IGDDCIMKINSLTGPIDTRDLGYTLMHEHILIANHTMRKVCPDWLNRQQFVEYAVKYIKRAKAHGVKTIVDMTTFQLGRDVDIMKEVAEKAEIQVIACTGFHWFEELCLMDKSVDYMAEILINDIEKGMEGTDIKASVIKACTDKFGINEYNSRLLKASAIAQKATGVPISTHACGSLGYDQTLFFEQEGIDMHKLIIGHVGDTDDLDFLKKIARKGCYLGLDRFGVDTRHPEMLSLEKRINTTLSLCEDGFIKSLVLSHDASCLIDYWEGQSNLRSPWELTYKTNLDEFKFQFDYISRFVLPELKNGGMTDDQINEMLIETPRRIFESYKKQ
ncbi:MAG TPA: amidohydrolase family protein, partial [Syntrophomonas sp.]|nr:amidohydrolase family protein [Syntrophomonas sp.]